MARLSARDVADYFLASVDEESGDNMTNLKLQKLCYYAQGVNLALEGEPLFDDPIEAWEHGPVVPSLYRDFRDYGSSAIPRPEDFDPDKYDAASREAMDEALDVFGQFSAWKLRDMTHAEPPWRDAGLNKVISHGAMRDYFQTLRVDVE